MKNDAQMALRAGLSEARKELGLEVQEWFNQKYLRRGFDAGEQVFTQAAAIPTGRIYMGVYDAPGNNKKGYWDVYPIIFHIDTMPFNDTDRLLIGINLNYFDSIQRAQFLDSVSTYFSRYIEENKQRLEKGDISQYSFGGMTEFLNGYIKGLGLKVSKANEVYIWSRFRAYSVVPIDYDDWKYLPLLVPFGVLGKPLSEIHNIR